MIKKLILKFIKKIINDNFIHISDYKIYVNIKPSAGISTINYLSKILDLSEKDYFLLLLSNSFINGFNKRGYTYKQAKKLLKKVKDYPDINLTAVPIINSDCSRDFSRGSSHWSQGIISDFIKKYLNK